MRGRRSKRWSVRRARLAGRVKQLGERGFRTRESFDGRVEAEFPALRALQMSEIAVAHFLRQRLVGRLPEWVVNVLRMAYSSMAAKHRYDAPG